MTFAVEERRKMSDENLTEVGKAIKLANSIVHCKDCKYWHKDSETELNFCLAFHDGKGGQIIAERDADDFCSRGERVE